MTSDNVSPMNLIYIRKVGYGIRKINEIANLQLVENVSISKVSEKNKDYDLDNIDFLENVLKRILENLK